MGLPKEYSMLFNAVTDTIFELERISILLKMVQYEAEEAHVARQEHIKANPLQTKLITFPQRKK